VRFRQQIVFTSIFLLLTLSGCGDFFVSEDTIESVKVTPTGALASVGDTVQFTATATNAGGQTSDATSSASWTSSSDAIATVSAGKATAVASGTATITAQASGKSGSGTLIIRGAKLQSIAITPSNPSVFSTQSTQQFTATGTFADNTTLDITNLVQWSSSSTSVATINSSGVATLVGSGTTTITASISSSGTTITANTNLTVT
jgi:trimeric autotransporter adhesin